MASSSASYVAKSFKYDVFLSFRGEDTRKNFIAHLYNALLKRNINTYKDDEEIKKGKGISDELIRSIEESKFFIIVFSKNYASSSWCLDELVNIMECHKTTGHTVYPIFYDVEPYEVRNQSRKVGEAFARHEKEEAAGKWRNAMKEAADVAGWELKNTADGDEAKFIGKIVEKLSLELRSINVRIDTRLIGMDHRINGIVSSLGTASDDVHMIGIWGMGGGGKTTLARSIFNRLYLEFEGKSFIENVREESRVSGLKSLQNQILSNILDNQTINIGSIDEGKSIMSWMMHGRKVLLVLDDVDHIEQLEALAGDTSWFMPGSIIIITTREQQVLVTHGVKIYNVNLLTDDESIWLFNRYAFGREIPIQKYEELSRQVVRYAAGLPLTIKVLGSLLCGKSMPEWVDALARLKKIPLRETQKQLEISYTGLDDEQKHIFLDVATILKGWKKKLAIEALECCGFFARIGLRVLEQKSLINFYDDYTGEECVGMHDHLEEMGRNIVRRLHPAMPCKHSRLWDNKEIEDVLAKNLGTEETRSIQYYYGMLDVEIIMKGLREMKELRFLVVDNQEILSNPLVPNFLNALEFLCCNWKNKYYNPYFSETLRYLLWNKYPFRYLPKTFQANNLVALRMDYSSMVQLWEGGERKVFNKLRFLYLRGSTLRSLDLWMTPSLETLTLTGLRKRRGRIDHLVELYIPGELQKLRSLELDRVKLRTLDLGLTPNLEKLCLGVGDLVELHMPGIFLNLKCLVLCVPKLRTLDIRLARNLEELSLFSCHDLEELHMAHEYLKLTSLHLEDMKMRTLDLRLVPCLNRLLLSQIKDLVELLLPSRCINLNALDCTNLDLRTLDLGVTPNLKKLHLQDCFNLVELHMHDRCLNLKSLVLSGLKLRTLDLGLTPNLEELNLSSCYDLEELHMAHECVKLLSLQLLGLKLRTLDLGPSPILTYIKISHLKLRTLDLRLVPYLNTLSLSQCKDLVELHLPRRCINLNTLECTNSKLRTPDLKLTPNLKYLDIEECNKLVDLHVPIGCLENIGYLNLSGCLVFKSFLFRSKNSTSGIVNESLEVRPVAELYFTLQRCLFHPDNNIMDFKFRCFHKDNIPSLTRSLEKLISGGSCVCTKLVRFLRRICRSQSAGIAEVPTRS